MMANEVRTGNGSDRVDPLRIDDRQLPIGRTLQEIGNRQSAIGNGSTQSLPLPVLTSFADEKGIPEYNVDCVPGRLDTR